MMVRVYPEGAEQNPVTEMVMNTSDISNLNKWHWSYRGLRAAVVIQ